MNEVQQNYVIKAVEETLERRVRNTIKEYVDKNARAFAENKIAGVEWDLQLTVVIDNLGLNPEPKPSLFKRLINAFKNFRKEASQAD